MLNKISDDSLEEVVGGVTRTVYNPGEENFANVRLDAGLDAQIVFTMDNGAKVETTGETQYADGIKWYQIELPGGGPNRYGWIAGTMLKKRKKHSR
jgi:uncharacterized protein YgiM (DUF1202 family)